MVEAGLAVAQPTTRDRWIKKQPERLCDWPP